VREEKFECFVISFFIFLMAGERWITEVNCKDHRAGNL
jgi:hypothetical protein